MFLVRGNIRKWLSSKFVRASEPVNLLFFFFLGTIDKYIILSVQSWVGKHTLSPLQKDLQQTER